MLINAESIYFSIVYHEYFCYAVKMQHHLANKQKWKSSIAACVSYYYTSRNNWRSIRREPLPKLSVSFRANEYRVISPKRKKKKRKKREKREKRKEKMYRLLKTGAERTLRISRVPTRVI